MKKMILPLKLALIVALGVCLSNPAVAQKRGKGKRIQTIFKKFDKNNDGKLTAKEVPAKLWARISKADANKDGAVTRKELVAFMRKHRKRQRK